MAAPTTWQAGKSNDPVWEEILEDFNKSHKATYGVDMNRSWDSDEDAKRQYQALARVYESKTASATPTTPAAPAVNTGIAVPSGTDMENWRDAVGGQFAIGANSYLEAMPDLQYSMDASRAIGGLQSRSAMDQYMLSNNLASRRSQFDGMEDKYAKTAFETNNQANQDRVAGQATADVAQQFGSMQAANQRNLARQGVNPNSGRALAMGNQTAIAQAAAQAGAANKARQDLDVLADSRQRTAIGFGTPLVGQAQSAAGLSNTLSNSAINSAAAPLNQRLSFAGGLSNIYGSAASGYGNLWQSQNLTAAQQADLDARNAASDDSNTNALLGAAGAFLGSNTGGKVLDKVLSFF